MSSVAVAPTSAHRPGSPKVGPGDKTLVNMRAGLVVMAGAFAMMVAYGEAFGQASSDISSGPGASVGGSNLTTNHSTTILEAAPGAAGRGTGSSLSSSSDTSLGVGATGAGSSELSRGIGAAPLGGIGPETNSDMGSLTPPPSSEGENGEAGLDLSIGTQGATSLDEILDSGGTDTGAAARAGTSTNGTIGIDGQSGTGN